MPSMAMNSTKLTTKVAHHRDHRQIRQDPDFSLIFTYNMFYHILSPPTIPPRSSLSAYPDNFMHLCHSRKQTNHTPKQKVHESHGVYFGCWSTSPGHEACPGMWLIYQLEKMDFPSSSRNQLRLGVEFCVYIPFSVLKLCLV